LKSGAPKAPFFLRAITGGVPRLFLVGQPPFEPASFIRQFRGVLVPHAPPAPSATLPFARRRAPRCLSRPTKSLLESRS